MASKKTDKGASKVAVTARIQADLFDYTFAPILKQVTYADLMEYGPKEMLFPEAKITSEEAVRLASRQAYFEVGRMEQTEDGWVIATWKESPSKDLLELLHCGRPTTRVVRSSKRLKLGTAHGGVTLEDLCRGTLNCFVPRGHPYEGILKQLPVKAAFRGPDALPVCNWNVPETQSCKMRITEVLRLGPTLQFIWEAEGGRMGICVAYVVLPHVEVDLTTFSTAWVEGSIMQV